MTASNEPSRLEVLTFNPEAVLLYGYHYSVYVRVVRLALLEKGVAWQHVEIDPFAKEIPADYLAMNPFGRVPTLRHGDFTLYETTAITRYIDEAFDGLPLLPSNPKRSRQGSADRGDSRSAMPIGRSFDRSIPIACSVRRRVWQRTSTWSKRALPARRRC